jgi:hypothetical protein
MESTLHNTWHRSGAHMQVGGVAVRTQEAVHARMSELVISMAVCSRYYMHVEPEGSRHTLMAHFATRQLDSVRVRPPPACGPGGRGICGGGPQVATSARVLLPARGASAWWPCRERGCRSSCTGSCS